MDKELGQFGKIRQEFWSGVKQAPNYIERGWGHLQSTKLGRNFSTGFAEGFGFQFADKPTAPDWIKHAGSERSIAKEAYLRAAPARHTYTGFMGLRNYGMEATAEKAAWKSLSSGATSAITKEIGEQTASKIGHITFGAAETIGFASRMVAPAIMAHTIYEGARHEGAWGGIKAAVDEGIGWGQFKIAESMLADISLGIAIPVTLAAAATVGTYAYGEAAHSYNKNLTHAEMGGNLVDPYGMNSTMRQRSLQALHNSHINGRMAIGNEAVLLHR